MKLPDNIDEVEPWSGDDQIPPGVYLARVADCKEEQSKQGNPMLSITWRIEKGDWKGAEIRDWVTAIESTAGRVRALFIALDYTPPADGNMLPKALVGKVGTIVVRAEDYTGRDGEIRTSTKVKGYRARDNGSDVDSNTAAFATASAGSPDDDVPF